MIVFFLVRKRNNYFVGKMVYYIVENNFFIWVIISIKVGDFFIVIFFYNKLGI